MTLSVTDIFCGAGGSSTGATQVPGVEIRMAANHWDLAVEVHNENHPTADHAAVDLHEEDPRYFPRTDVLWASPECFTAGHMVTTTHGQVPIEDVQVGDYVLTHRGRWRPVIRVQSRTAPTVIVKGQGHAGIETTASHKFWLRGSRRVWKGRPEQYRREYDEPTFGPIGEAVEREALWATPVRVAPLPAYEAPCDPTPPLVFGLDLTAAWWLVGRWVGDGSLTFGRNHEVLIACGFHEADELRERLANTGIEWAESAKRTAVVFSIGNEKARDYLHDHFGHGAAEKQIPSWALTMPRSHRRALLDGYHSADGYVNALTHGVQHRTSTVSRRLAVSCRLLVESLGFRASVGTDKRTTYSIEGRTGTARPQHIVAWNQTPSSARNPEAWADDLHAWSRVRSVTTGATAATVYNIEVEEDHSYVLDGIVVANCTKWSQASGGKYRNVSTEPNLLDLLDPDLVEEDPDTAIVQRSRLLMFDVLRFAEHHRYAAIVVENVVDVATNARYADAWALWKRSLTRLGYEYRVVSLNSMHAQAHGAPAPQSRDRLYVVCWLRGNKAPDIDRILRPKAWCPSCEQVVESSQAWKNGRAVGKYRSQYVYLHAECGTTVEPGYLPAAAAIDLTLPGARIGDRSKPLADKTRRRIAAGIARYWRPFHIEATGNQYDAADPKHPAYGRSDAYYRAWPVDDVLKTLHTQETKALVVPLEGRAGDRCGSVNGPLRTQTSRHLDALVTPFIAELRGGGSTARPVTQPAATFTASGNHHGLVMPYYGASASAAPTSKPIGALTTVDIDAAAAQVDDCLFRMLEPHEVAAGMAFPTDYIWRGTRRQRVKLAGNAVTPPAARDLIAAVAESLGAEVWS